jgi:uncharacterized protein YkwD
MITSGTMTRGAAMTSVVLGLVLSQAAQGSAIEAANAVRREGCEQRRGVAEPLRRSAEVDRVASRWSAGGRLQAAQDAEGFHARRSVAVKLPAAWDDAKIAASLRASNCQELTDGAFREAGLSLRDDSIWLVLAAPYVVPDAAAASRVAAEVLARVNQVRASGHRCASDSFDPAPPLRASPLLAGAAKAHARDMAQNGFLSHAGSDGSDPAQRAQRAGYHWQLIGENVAGGPSSAKEVVEGWLASPDHCRNIMEPQYTQMAVAYASNQKSNLVIYWSQLFGRPR